MKTSTFLLCTLLGLLPGTGLHGTATARDIHVSTTGNDAADGTTLHPLRTIQAGADRAQPGDVVWVHAGTYRERVSPPRSGTAQQPISYRAADDGRVEIKGSEVVKGWKHVDRNTWLAKVPNALFGAFNPYADTLHGDWLERSKWCHTGEVYVDDTALRECRTLEALLYEQTAERVWYSRVTADTTYLWANFPGADPNRRTVEINVRRCVFYPEHPGVDYIHVSGFVMSHAATPWAPPTAEQPGLIGTHWSKGWVIENNTVRHSKCVGISLGKYGDEWDNRCESVEGYVATVRRALDNGWNRATVGSHLVRNNRISHCGQAGIAGSLGAIFSTVADNVISDIGRGQSFWGYEIAGIKFHAPVDVVIRHNHIYRTEGGIWLDWMAQGTRITGNLLHDNTVQDFSLEVNHGPILVDNNLFLSGELAQIKLSQGVSFVHNTMAWKIWPTGTRDNRQTPYLEPHGTAIAGLHDCPAGNAMYRNNLFIRADMTPYDDAPLPVDLRDNLYWREARPARCEPAACTDTLPREMPRVVEEADGWYLYMAASADWTKTKTRRTVRKGELGVASIPHQGLTDLPGVPDRFDTDFLQRKRRRTNPWPGAIEFTETGNCRLKVYGPDAGAGR